MAMVMITDDAASDPRVLACGDRADEVFGLVVRASVLSGKHYTDGRFTGPMLASLNPTRWRELIDIAAKHKIVVKLPRRDEWELLDQARSGRGMFISVLSRAEKEWTEQRRRDNANPRLTMAVKQRDGDACRYCSVVVHWSQRNTPRAGTYDHRLPPGPGGTVRPGTVAASVVACKTCNSRRGGMMTAGASIAECDAALPLLPVPERPFFSAYTANQLSKFYGRPFVATTAEDLHEVIPEPAHPDPTGSQGAADPGRERQPAAPQPFGEQSDTTAAVPRRDAALPPGITAGQGPPESADISSEVVSGQGREGEGRVAVLGASPADPASARPRRRGSRGGKRRR